jgi:AcrR family transcriptional regulator
MGRRSLRAQRRVDLARAFARVLGTHGQGGATIAAAAAEAGMAASLVHHYFESKQDLYETVLEELRAAFRRRLEGHSSPDPLDAYVTAALALNERSDVSAARAWVGVFAEALGDPVLFAKVRRAMDAEVEHVERRARGTLSSAEAAAVVAFVVGALVLGAFAPRKTAGFAAPSLRRMLKGLRTPA